MPQSIYNASIQPIATKEAPAQIASADQPRTQHSSIRSRKFTAVSLLGAFLLGAASMGMIAWCTTTTVKPALAITNPGKAPVDHTKDQEGQDEHIVSNNALAAYTVAAPLPRLLSIGKLNITARVMPMSVNTDGSIQAPVNTNDSGWYTKSAEPGETGAMFIDGHASGATRQGLFGRLDALKEGDTMQIEKGDGTKLTYRVVHTEIVPLDGLDMATVLRPYTGVQKGLNLMTCTGTWIPRKATFDHRVVVYTEQL